MRLLRKGQRKRVLRGLHRVMACATLQAAVLTGGIAGPLNELAESHDVRAVFASATVSDEAERADIWEIFAGHAEVTHQAVQLGLKAVQPVDLRYGHDLLDASVRAEIMEVLYQQKPRLIVIGFPCTVYSQLTRLAYRTPERWGELARRRKREEPFLELVKDITEFQLGTGGDVIIENPRHSAAWEHPILRGLEARPEIRAVDLDWCMYGLRHPGTGRCLRKPTRLLVSSAEFTCLARACDGSHAHDVTMGKAVTEHAGRYTAAFARAILRAYLVKRERQACGVLAVRAWRPTRRIRTKMSQEQARQKEADLAGGEPGSDAGSDNAAEHSPGEEEEPGPGSDREDLLGAQSITFRSTEPIRAEVKRLLRRLHQNLGHPAEPDLTRHLRLAGAASEVLQASKALRCSTCRRVRGPAQPGVARLPRAREALEEVGLDVLTVHDVNKVAYKCLSMLDLASTYHVVVLLKSNKPRDVLEAFMNGWVNTFGAPRRVLLDLDGGFRGEFQDALDRLGTTAETAAGQAHWQHGRTERQGGWWREIAKRVIEHQSVAGHDDMAIMLAQVSMAKNDLRRRWGFSPAQWVLGRSPFVPGGLIDDPDNLPAHAAIAENQQYARVAAIRAAARSAFMDAENDQVLRRALLRKAHVRKQNYDVGDRVFYFRIPKNVGNKKKWGIWKGPGRVVGHEATNLWIAHGGQCILCAPEQVRLAVSEELWCPGMQPSEDDIQDLQHLGAVLGETRGTYDDARDEVPPPSGGEEGGSGDEPMPRLVPIGGLVEGAPGDGAKRGLEQAEADGPETTRQRVLAVNRHPMTERARRKAAEKELPWSSIPDADRPLYEAAMRKQWDEWQRFGSVRVLDLQESRHVRATTAPERILRSRFAFRDKNAAIRTPATPAPVKAKARLCVGGDADPDLAAGTLRTDAPTVGRLSTYLVLQVALFYDMQVVSGDVEGAFMQGDADADERPGQLYIAQPKQGLPGLHPEQLLEVCKGVYGLATAPRQWWVTFRRKVLAMRFPLPGGDNAMWVQSRLDSALFILAAAGGGVVALLSLHVDDMMLAYRSELAEALPDEIQNMFSLGGDGWQEPPFEYTGKRIEREVRGGETVYIIRQTAFTQGRLEPVTVRSARVAPGLAEATHLEVHDNRSAVGCLSWLAGQTRPDLAYVVAQQQRTQNAPTTANIRETNKAVRLAKQHADFGIVLRRIDLFEAVLVVYHDAAWANAAEPGDEELVNAEPSQEAPRLRSQAGVLIFLAQRQVADGREGLGSLLDWRSHTIRRIVRSTFAAELLAAGEALDDAVRVRGAIAEVLYGSRVELTDLDPQLLPLVLVTDCRSIYDCVHKDGPARLPSERRLALDLAAFKEALSWETPEAGPTRAGVAPVRWVPTAEQAADCLTKLLDGEMLRRLVTEGRLRLSEYEPVVCAFCQAGVPCGLKSEEKVTGVRTALAEPDFSART